MKRGSLSACPRQRLRLLLEGVFFVLTVIWVWAGVNYGFGNTVVMVIMFVASGGSFVMSVWALRVDVWAPWRRKRHPQHLDYQTSNWTDRRAVRSPARTSIVSATIF